MRFYKSVFFVIVLTFLGCNKARNPFTIELTNLKSLPATIDSNGSHKATVLYFISPECPLCRGYSLGFRKISESYAGRDVLFLGIVPGNFYSEIEAEQFKVKYSVPFEIYIDKSMLLTDYLKATVTPEVFLLDASGQIIYSGKIDDWAAATGVHKQVITHNYLTDALDSFLKNEPVKLKHTQAVGCFIE